MIQVLVERDKRHIRKIEVSGHAMYDDYGKDIVCASASSILYTSFNAILTFDKEALEVVSKEGYMRVVVKKFSEITDKLLDNLLEMLAQLAEQYPKNIKIK